MVGQRFIQLLEDHPWFEVAWLAASERSSGLPYAEAARWKLNTPIPERVARMHVNDAVPNGAPKVIFAALDTAPAKEIEPKFAEAGHAVVTNSSAFRMHSDVPLVIPEVNGDHFKLIDQQPTRRRNGGYIATNPNCSAIGLVMALAPIHRAFGLEAVFVATMQAVSGAGYPGVASLDILGNVIPYIAKEEEKLEAETKKLLGDLSNGSVKDAGFKISAQCNRVAVEDGHTESVSIKLKKAATGDEIRKTWSTFRSYPREIGLPSAPERVVVYNCGVDRPQPRLDVNQGAGMSATVGRLRPCSLLDWKFTVLSHNTIRGAAGAALLNAELLKHEGYL
jgi:aspartate-semialdehyde dehydrogenase